MSDEIEQLATEHSDAFRTLADVSDQLRLVKTHLRGLRTRIADTVVTHGAEPWKRDTTNELATVADSIENALVLLEEGPMSSRKFKAELVIMLMASPAIAAVGQHIIEERANNIAQAYMGRIVKESE